MLGHNGILPIIQAFTAMVIIALFIITFTMFSQSLEDEEKEKSEATLKFNEQYQLNPPANKEDLKRELTWMKRNTCDAYDWIKQVYEKQKFIGEGDLLRAKQDCELEIQAFNNNLAAKRLFEEEKPKPEESNNAEGESTNGLY